MFLDGNTPPKLNSTELLPLPSSLGLACFGISWLLLVARGLIGPTATASLPLCMHASEYGGCKIQRPQVSHSEVFVQYAMRVRMICRMNVCVYMPALIMSYSTYLNCPSGCPQLSCLVPDARLHEDHPSICTAITTAVVTDQCNGRRKNSPMDGASIDMSPLVPKLFSCIVLTAL
jgi:hypothetical protein